MIGRTVSHYKILEKLGEGGMGVVYRAEDTTLKRIVALKFLPPELTSDAAAKQRFIHEAQAASSLDHPNICTIYEIGETPEGQTFICMTCCTGSTLKKHIEGGPLPVATAVDIAIQIARGLSRAHEAGVIHRDIKPANIMVTDRGEVKILDFGLAKFAGQTGLTRLGTTVGTAAYMSPEQARGDVVDHRTDIWSLGVVLYEMIAGRVPFPSAYEQATIYLILNNDPPPLGELRSGIPAGLEQVVDRCLTKTADERYPTVDKVIEDLESIVRARSSVTAPVRTASGVGAAAARVPSIAVLPFRDMSPERDQEYFCEGIAEELINGLAQIEGLRVAARTSAFQFKSRDVDVRRIGKELGVESVLEGSVRKAGDRLRVTAQLVSVSDGYHLWSEKYDRDLEDIFAIQDEISLSIVEKLRGKLLKEERSKLVRRYTDDEEAYNLYLKGRYCWNRRHEGGIHRALELFEQAVSKAPLHAPAYVGMADCYNSACHLALMDPRVGYAKAKKAVARALEIDDGLADAHASLGWIKTFHDWDWIGAEREFHRAIALNSKCAVAHYFYGLYLGVVARYDESVAEATLCRALDPVDLVFNSVRGLALYWDRRYDESIDQMQKTLDMDPSFYLAHLFLGFSFTGKAMWREAVDSFARVAALSPGSPLGAGYIGYALAASGETKEAIEQLERLDELSKEKFVSSFYKALIHYGLGANDRAIACLENSFVEKESWLPTIATFPLFEGLRSDPRVVAIIEKMGLSP
jgi:TolB-like protein/tRNA A-37 threonylcarbamoyl transferase component Bud32